MSAELATAAAAGPLGPEDVKAIGSLLAFAIAAIGTGNGLLGPEVCVNVGALILLTVASPRDVWQIARERLGKPRGGED